MNPDLINYEIQDVPQQSDIRTEESEPLNPATNNTRVFRFKINNTGFLDGTSMINKSKSLEWCFRGNQIGSSKGW